MLRTAGKSEAEIKTVMDMAARSTTPALQAVFGFVGTLVTGVVVSAIIGAFIRARSPRPAGAAA
jgi:hypothetical protein